VRGGGWCTERAAERAPEQTRRVGGRAGQGVRDCGLLLSAARAAEPDVRARRETHREANGREGAGSDVCWGSAASGEARPRDDDDDERRRQSGDGGLCRETPARLRSRIGKLTLGWSSGLGRPKGSPRSASSLRRRSRRQPRTSTTAPSLAPHPSHRPFSHSSTPDLVPCHVPRRSHSRPLVRPGTWRLLPARPVADLPSAPCSSDLTSSPPPTFRNANHQPLGHPQRRRRSLVSRRSFSRAAQALSCHGLLTICLAP
jgi:hypothetical protein